MGTAGNNREESAALLMRECRGLVLGPQVVVARPIHKFFEEGQIAATKHGQVADKVVWDARKKLDGTMIYGVVHPTEGWVELWTRAGPSGPGKWATRFAEEGSAGDILGLVGELDRRGYTASFEWVGRQAWVKERHNDSELVITQVRHKDQTKT